MSENFQIFLTTFHILYQDDQGRTRERSDPIYHAAPDLKTAVVDALRFYEGRLKTDEAVAKMADVHGKDPIQPHWSPLGAMVTAAYTIGQIGLNGEYNTRHGLVKFEWKCDSPWSLRQEVVFFTTKE